MQFFFVIALTTVGLQGLMSYYITFKATIMKFYEILKGISPSKIRANKITEISSCGMNTEGKIQN